MSLPKRFFGGATADDGAVEQVELPRLPVPPLEQTMAGYLSTLQPLLTPQQLEYTRGLVQTFTSAEGPGPRIQEQLLQRQQAMDNWAYDWWLQDMYLNIPLCLPVNVSPGMVFPPRQFRSNADIARYAARLVTLATQHKNKLDRKALPLERAASREKGQPLCMSQYYRLFTSYRVPGTQQDNLISTSPTTEHIIVTCNDQLYVLYLRKDGTGDRLSEEQLASQFAHILTTAPGKSMPVGILTSQRRDHWAESREILIRDEKNRQNLELIENSLLVICLDQKPLSSKFNRKAGPKGADGHRGEGRDETNMAHQMLHGGGSAFNSGNRWFDKTIQLVLCPDGVCGLCYEHSPSEGIAVIQLMEDWLDACKDLGPGKTSIPPSCTALRPLRWNLDTTLEKHIRDASHSIDNLVEDLDFYVYRFNGYGKDFIKSCNVSPDAYIQLALQLAYYKLYKRLTATYESASTRRFMLGRVDCIRSATSAALQWAAAMSQSEETSSSSSDPLHPNRRVTFSIYSDSEKLKFFDEAVKSQTDIMVANILGQGIDIHLLGLREQGKEMGLQLELFSDEAYKIANHFALSTSQVATKSDSFMGYGPVVPDGYGASYNPKASQIIFCISAFYSSETTKASRFAQSVEDSLNAMQTLLMQRQK
ncbi:choline O-acetyltransferase-like isoform X1 [Macrosteles quadrilineatus]|uniref:choline O-acetyltransferase-like isoform X1 n=1 Tax=Macrosteles quadrilineatus TaxID=74068 RepID=UPI0023E29AEB|nr:choline O-acetyltransferase-like isoform X1 [Macrosteles quadrilineatus]